MQCTGWVAPKAVVATSQPHFGHDTITNLREKYLLASMVFFH
jgi:hypothetical protein